MAMYITAAANNEGGGGIWEQCPLCGEKFEWGTAIAVVYLHEDMPDGSAMVACNKCAKGSVENIKSRMLDRASSLRQMADDLETAASSEITLPPVSDYTSIEEQIAAAHSPF